MPENASPTRKYPLYQGLDEKTLAALWAGRRRDRITRWRYWRQAAIATDAGSKARRPMRAFPFRDKAGWRCLKRAALAYYDQGDGWRLRRMEGWPVLRLALESLPMLADDPREALGQALRLNDDAPAILARVCGLPPRAAIEAVDGIDPTKAVRRKQWARRAARARWSDHESAEAEAARLGVSTSTVERRRRRAKAENDGMPTGDHDGMPTGDHDGMPTGDHDGMPTGDHLFLHLPGVAAPTPEERR